MESQEHWLPHNKLLCPAHFLIKHIPLCHENHATVARPSLLHAGDAIHPVLQKGVVWFTRLMVLYYSSILYQLHHKYMYVLILVLLLKKKKGNLKIHVILLWYIYDYCTYDVYTHTHAVGATKPR